MDRFGSAERDHVSIGFGIRALAALFTADVKKAFESNRPDGVTGALA